MSAERERYSQSDVTLWGAVAIGCVALAVGSATISSFVPPSLVAGLHATRIEGGSFNALRGEVTGLRTRVDRIILENGQLKSQVNIGERDRGDVTKRVAALENSLPTLLEQVPIESGVDLSSVTASTTKPAQAEATDGGSVSVSTQPMFADQAMPAAPTSTDPAMDSGTSSPSMREAASALAPNLTRISSDGFGVSLGKPVDAKSAYLAWTDTRNKVGALLLGLTPLLTSASGDKFHLVAGPLPDIAQAQELCTHLTRAGLSCNPVSYAGYALPQ